jgi:hypothetical protein
MTEDPTISPRQVKFAFENNFVVLKVDQITPLKTLRPGIKKGRKYAQIVNSIVSVALRPILLALDVYFDRSLCARGIHFSDNALTAAASAGRSMTSGSNRSGAQRRIFSCSGWVGSLMASR